MNRNHLYRFGFPLMAIALIAWVMNGCDRSTSSASANQKNINHPELFSIPPEQASHVQIIHVEQTTLVRILRLIGAFAYNDFHTVPVINQVSGLISRIVVFLGQYLNHWVLML